MATNYPYSPVMSSVRQKRTKQRVGKEYLGARELPTSGAVKPLSETKKRKATLACIHLMRGKSTAEKKEVLEMLGLIPSVS